jgi:hypothetical protein
MARFLSKFFKKLGNFQFTATLACTKRALFITKKGTFSPLNKFGGHVPPGSYAAVLESQGNWILRGLLYEARLVYLVDKLNIERQVAAYICYIIKLNVFDFNRKLPI